MKTITCFLKRILSVAQNFFKKISTLIAMLVKRGAFALPRDEVERLEVMGGIYKTLTVVLALSVLFAGVWLADHEYPSWPALLLFILRLLYALPAKRVERLLRKHQYEERKLIAHSNPRHT